MEGGTGRRHQREVYVYLQLTHAIVQQKLTQHYKVIIFQLKNKVKKKRIKELQSVEPRETERSLLSLH